VDRDSVGAIDLVKEITIWLLCRARLAGTRNKLQFVLKDRASARGAEFALPEGLKGAMDMA
jgi:hypothetical protein